MSWSGWGGSARRVGSWPSGREVCDRLVFWKLCEPIFFLVASGEELVVWLSEFGLFSIEFM